MAQINDLTEEDIQKIDLEIDKIDLDDEKNRVLHEIHEIYTHTMGLIHQGTNTVYHPDMFAYLTEKQFTKWILENNYAIRQMME